MATLLERYDAGERRDVWNDLHALGPLSGASAGVRQDVEAVAKRTMERVASNLVVIHDRLVALSFRFQDPECSLVLANGRHPAELDVLEKYVGAVPASLRALLGVIEGASFRGWLPSRGSADSWYDQFLDPFEFLPDVRGEIDRLEDDEVGPNDRDFRLTIAGDYLHKNDVSGGAPTVVPLPSDEVDARVIEDDGVWFKAYMANVIELGSRSDALDATPQQVEQPIWLVDYLRMYFEAGGFRRVAGTTAYPEDLMRDLADGLLEI
ncbi:MAG: hypothetical protein JOZ86_16480 [Candidatus Eremiobacteraeota bacterium]|nr:hypothetical protein [Candidatus Eremiobacteraeota bacterium]